MNDIIARLIDCSTNVLAFYVTLHKNTKEKGDVIRWTKRRSEVH